MPVTYKLSEPLQTHKGEIRELVFKAPRARAFLDYGTPLVTTFTENRDGTVSYRNSFDYACCFKFMAEMSGVDQSDLEMMAAADLNEALASMVSAFAPSVGAKDPLENSNS
ncbi:hypothetical protein E8L99_16515 [Phreatobacter aquaticus]|uniref:Phage tail assembly protein n=1 Tax=Phreatobacter aquaticus TaxID=2570229 RepID=A0A4D7QJI5_9HYPH|nr:hypothetical protein [Phreatobacter aquaticus]QCK87245.1 hypothetical protein E8L99_16515 [Phreatobacter aquaticus]